MGLTITTKADIHPDGDVYVYNKVNKKYYRIGVLIPDSNIEFDFMPNGELYSAPAINPCWEKAKRVLKLTK